MYEEMTNGRLRQAAEEKRVPLWKVAEKFGVTDSHFSRWLRREFSEERMKQALQYIDDIADSRQQGA